MPHAWKRVFKTPVLQAAAVAAKKAAEAKQRAQDRAPTATIELSERFYARPGDLYECFTNPGRVQAFSQSPAQVSLSNDPNHSVGAKHTVQPACASIGAYPTGYYGV